MGKRLQIVIATFTLLSRYAVSVIFSLIINIVGELGLLALLCSYFWNLDDKPGNAVLIFHPDITAMHNCYSSCNGKPETRSAE